MKTFVWGENSAVRIHRIFQYDKGWSAMHEIQVWCSGGFVWVWLYNGLEWHCMRWQFFLPVPSSLLSHFMILR